MNLKFALGGKQSILNFHAVPECQSPFKRHFVIDEGRSTVDVQVARLSFLDRQPLVVNVVTQQRSPVN
jgi:hypothetical protein